jgi:hypothetical protein
VLTRRRIVVAIAVVLVAILTALAVSSFVWAKSYAPLRVTAYGPGFGVSRRPVGSNPSVVSECGTLSGCGHLAFAVRGKRTHFAEFHVVVKNDGRWPITIRRRNLESYCTLPINVNNCIELHALRQGPPGTNGLSTRPLGPLRVPAHASTDLWVRFLTSCRKHDPSYYSSGGYSLPVAYRYLGHFERTQNVPMPFDIDFLC